MSNSIQHLMVILKEAAGSEINLSVGSVWASVLTTGTSPIEIYAGLAKLVWLVQEVRNDLLSLPNIP